MASNCLMSSSSNDQEILHDSEIEHISNELTNDSKNPDAFACQTLFKKFEYFKQETIMLSNPEDMKKKLNQSVSLWKELLNIVENVNEQNKRDFDQSRVLVSKIFSDMQTADLFKNDNQFSRQIFFNYLDILNTQEIQHFFVTSSSTTLTDSIRESNIYILINVTSSLLVVPSLLHAGFAKNVLEWLNYPTLTANERRPMVSIVHNLARHDAGIEELNKYSVIEIIKQLQKNTAVCHAKVSLLTTMALALLSTPDQIKADPTGFKTILNQLLHTTIQASNAERYRYNAFHVSEPLAVLVKLFVDDSTLDYVMNHAEIDPPSNPASTIKLFSDLLIRFHVAHAESRLEQFTLIALFNILWSISFHEVYHEILKQNTELINTIKNVAKDNNQIILEQYVPRSMQSVKKAADGILFNLHLEIPPTIIPIMQSTTLQEKPLVMLSYSHANNEFCDKILELLDQKTDLFDIWIDKRCCKSSADVWESIAKGIKNAQLIICIVSTEYLASKACRQEIIYAKDRLNKRFLPVYLEKPDTSDWLDIRLAEFKYIRFQNRHLKLNERKVEEFLSTLMESILPEDSTVSNITHPQHHTPSTHHESVKTEVATSQTRLTVSKPTKIGNTTNESILKWTQTDIHHWFAQHEICSEIRDMYQFKTGAHMITYAECLKDEWQKQYERYAPRYTQQYAGKELPEHEFALFVSALRQLLSDFVQCNDFIN